MNLIKNELLKLRKRKGAWVMAIVLVVFAIGLSAMSAFLINQPEQAEEVQGMINTFAEEEGITAVPEEHTLTPLIDNASLMSIVTMFTIITAAGITAGEHTKGTIKLLLIRPTSRSKILLSKAVAVVLFAAAATMLLMLSSLVAGFLFYGWDLPAGHYVQMGAEGEFVSQPIYVYAAGLFGLEFIQLLVFASMAFMIGTVFKSSALGIGVPLVLLFTGSTAAMLVADYGWSALVLFSHTDMVVRFMGHPGVLEVPLAVSGLVLALYGAAFLAISFWRFTTQDVLD
ncbi:ABC transporter permease subunit [Alkalicoccus chagannorensis]|uniref:ABC transporter permease subunit n=1 Tax=Alkalicoccus chagannorensis TaxID=427072 RepID=UPI000428FBAC|nr:ABC transporter permease subunit [Alkalicoccus chagannorensis]